jgi:tetratricopeptide (TPR) repeat protein
MLARLLRADEPSVYVQTPWEDVADEVLPPPPLREGLGSAHLEVRTREPLAQAYFDQGLRLLHLGWGAEARRSFAEAARRDSELAMAWWGLALTRGAGARFAGPRAEAIRRALALSEGTSDLEQRYVVAASLLADKGPSNGRHAFVRDMECLVDRYPEDGEARLLLAGFLVDGYEADGRPGQGQPYAQALLRELLRTHPDHAGVHHAWVQAMLHSARPEAALESARKLVELAPAASPALLTAGRLLQRVGLGDEARRALEAAVAADDAYLASESLPSRMAPSAETAMRLLSQGCAEAGRYTEAQSWARRLRHRVEGAGSEPQAVLFAALSMVSAHLRFGFWRAAADVPMELPDSATQADRALRDGVRHYTRGLSALESGRLPVVEHACEALDALHPPLSEERRSEGRALCPRDVARVVEVAAQELRGALEARRGDMGRAEATLTRALRLERRLRAAGPMPFSRPAREALARLRLHSDREDRALELSRTLVSERPGCGHARLLSAEVLVALGAWEEAVAAFTAFLDCWRDADAHLPELRRARLFIAGRGRVLRLVRPSELAVASEAGSPGPRPLEKVSC